MIDRRFDILNLRWLCLSFIVILLDFFMKKWVMSHCYLGEVIILIPGINCYYVHNSGIAFSLFSDLSSERKWIFSLFAIIMIVILLFMLMCNFHNNKYLFRMAYSMIIGGAFGNVYDRICYGIVIDYIDCYIGNFHWPTFNIADISIIIGVLLVLFNQKSCSK